MGCDPMGILRFYRSTLNEIVFGCLSHHFSSRLGGHCIDTIKFSVFVVYVMDCFLSVLE